MADSDKDAKSIRFRFSLNNFLKIVGALAFIGPVTGAYIEYRQSVKQTKDEAFRTTVKLLSSENVTDRVAAATTLGTYISSGSEYQESAMLILINEVAVEQNINVLNAISASLKEIESKEYQRVIQRSLDLARNLFIYEYPLSKDSTSEAYLQIAGQKDIVANFISILLGLTASYDISGLNVYQNEFNSLLLTDLKMISVRIKNTVICLSNLSDTEFENSSIVGTSFANSILYNCTFSNCTISNSLFTNIKSFQGASFRGTKFDNTYFFGSDLTGTDFSEAERLKPVYFYGSLSRDKAIFSDTFRNELEGLSNMNHDMFLDTVYNSELISLRKEELAMYVLDSKY